MQKISIAVHGGAGTILKKDLTPQLEQQYLQALQAALDAGYGLLQQGASATDAVQAAVVVLEDFPLFNAGRGSVFTFDGVHEMDAAIMDGRDRSAGAVAGVQGIKNPILLARSVMANSQHVLLSGRGAEAFARNQGLAFADADYFHTDLRYQQWKSVEGSNVSALDHSASDVRALSKEKKFGTVGAVAVDAQGHVAAATSTGGMTNKRWGRIGDSPLIGAGTWADDRTCAISCTGHGEIFIKAVVAYDIHCLMEYKNKTLQEAMDEVVQVKLKRMEGEGGAIGVDAQGAVALVFKSEGMYRGMRSSRGENLVAIYG